MERRRSVPRFMIAAAGSGSGKTTVTCGLLAAFARRGVKMASFKCGPDYIDPMFHTEVLGIPSRNLDLFFTDENATRFLLCRAAAAAFGERDEGPALALIEGVMGYYDGLAAISTKASSYDLARATQTPAVLLADCRGRSVSILAELKGFLEYREDSGIRGVILNRLSPMLYPEMKRMIEEELNIAVCGYVPVMKDCGLESRHLGLVTAQEVGNLREIVERLADQMEKTVDLDRLLELAEQTPELTYHMTGPIAGGETEPVGKGQKKKPRIGVARDKAFCFYYQDNMDLLEELGAELAPFSPLEDSALPEGLSGLIFGGGYPELYLKQLSQNRGLMGEIRAALESGMPCIAECGGFMYLHEWILDEEGGRWPMAGVIKGESFPTGKLGRFGYISLTARRDTLLCREGGTLRGHEFHYWDSTNTGDCYLAEKPLRNRTWNCILSDGIQTQGNLSAGYPHIHFYSNPQAAGRFVTACSSFSRGLIRGGDLI